MRIWNAMRTRPLPASSSALPTVRFDSSHLCGGTRELKHHAGRWRS
jgi:hypothetical protein